MAAGGPLEPGAEARGGHAADAHGAAGATETGARWLSPMLHTLLIV